MSKHTKGPWLMDKRSENLVGSDGKNVRVYGAGLSMSGLPDDTSRANARLIAAAPELLEALKGVLPYMEQAESAGLVGDEGCHWPVEIVRAAIAKAEVSQ